MVPAIWASGKEAEGQNRFKPIDVFGLEWASDPQISPDGRQTVYVRNFMDIMTDRRRSNLWMINNDGTEHRPLTTGEPKRHLAPLVSAGRSDRLPVKGRGTTPRSMRAGWTRVRRPS